MIPVVSIFQQVVNRVNDNLIDQMQMLDSTIEGIQYEHGHPLEIVETLRKRDKTSTFRFQKYPLIALFQDFPERKGLIGFQSEVTLHLIIAKGTDKNYKAKERYEHNFNPFLYPVYEEFLKQINREPKFLTYGVSKIEHTKTDRLFWGRNGLFGNTANVFSDFLDVIEIKNLKLKVNLSQC